MIMIMIITIIIIIIIVIIQVKLGQFHSYQYSGPFHHQVMSNN